MRNPGRQSEILGSLAGIGGWPRFIDYEETEHYRIYKDFLEHRHRYLNEI